MSLQNQSVIEKNDAFKIKMEELIKEILIDNDMPYYRIESKMEFNGGQDTNNYHPVIRIVTYFEDTVTKISDLLQTEFDLTNVGVAAKKGLNVENFSYKHVQYFAGLKPARQALTEYKRSADKKFEIQVSSMLQDAWVGIEKELGYDSTLVPDEVKRDFYRVGALLEMADIQFLKIRSLLKNATANNASATVPAPQPAQATTFAEHLQAAADEAAKQAAQAPIHTAIPVAATVVAAAAAIPLAEKLKNTLSAAPETEEEHTDTNVDKVSEVAENVNDAAKNGITEDILSGLVNMGATTDRLAITPEEEHSDLIAPIAEEETTAPHGDGEALNTDNAQGFNMSVNEGNEKTTAIVSEHSSIPPASDKTAPFYNQDPKTLISEGIDEHALMTDASLRDYVQNSKALKEVDMQIAERAGAKLNAEIDIEGDVDRLKFLKVNTLKQLHERIIDNSADIVAFAEKWIGKDNGGSFDSGICLFYLEYLLVGKKNDPAFAVEYVVKFISDNDYSARYIIPTYNSIRNVEQVTSHAHLTLKS